MSITMADLTRYRLIPVVVINDAQRAAGLAEALVAGGLPVAEVTLRTPAALDAIAAIAGREDLLVGAGSVFNAAQARDALAAGARFLVSPGLDEDVVRFADAQGVPVVPGAVTATEIMRALSLGLTHVKFFPASIVGGAAALKALGSVFGGLSFIPTGGIGPANVGQYLALPQVAAVGGSWMVPSAAIDAGDTERIASLCAEAVAPVSSLSTLNHDGAS